MDEVTKVCLREVSPHLVCVLCGGYIIQAITVQECLHSFCRSCLVRYLETSEVCPICDVTLHKDKPHQNIRDDPLLQSLVYKLVPGLYHREMKSRRQFYDSHVTESNSDDSSDSSSHDDFLAMDRGILQSHVYPDVTSPDAEISLCLQLTDKPPPYKHRPLKRLKVKDSPVLDRRFLLCPASFPIRLLKKFIRGKFELCDKQEISVYYSEERLSDACTLMDVCYIYKWNKMVPLQLFYTVTNTILEDDMEVCSKDMFESKPKSEKVLKKSPTKAKYHKTKNQQTQQPRGKDMGFSQRGSVFAKFNKTRKPSSSAASLKSQGRPSKTASDRTVGETSIRKVVSKSLGPVRSRRRSRTGTQQSQRSKKTSGKQGESSRVPDRRKLVKHKKPKKTADVPSLKGNVSESDEHATCSFNAKGIDESVGADIEGTHAPQDGDDTGVPLTDGEQLNKQLHGSQGKHTDIGSATTDCQGDQVTENSSDNVNNEQYVDCKSNQITETPVMDSYTIDVRQQAVGTTEMESDKPPGSLGEANGADTVKTPNTQVPPTCHELSVLKAQKYDLLRQGKGKQPPKTDKHTGSVKQVPVKSHVEDNSSEESDSDHPPMEICTDVEDNLIMCDSRGHKTSEENVHFFSTSGITQIEDEKQNNLNLLAEAATLTSKASGTSIENQTASTDPLADVEIPMQATDVGEHRIPTIMPISDVVHLGTKADKSSKQERENVKQCESLNRFNDITKGETDFLANTLHNTEAYTCQYTQCVDNDYAETSISKNKTDGSNIAVKVQQTDLLPRSSSSEMQTKCTTPGGAHHGLMYRHPAVHVKNVEVQTEGTNMEISSPILASVMANTSHYSNSTDFKFGESEVYSTMSAKETMKEENTNNAKSVTFTTMPGSLEHSDGGIQTCSAKSHSTGEVTTLIGKHESKSCSTADRKKTKEHQVQLAAAPKQTTQEFTDHKTQTSHLNDGKPLVKNLVSHFPDSKDEDRSGAEQISNYPTQSNATGSLRTGEQSPSDGKKNPISFAKKYRCPARLGRTENKSHSTKNDKNKLARKSSQDNSDPYIFTADDNHNYVNGASPQSEDRHSPTGSTPRNALAFLEEYVNYVHSNQQEFPNHSNLNSNRGLKQQVNVSPTTHGQLEESATGGHVILGTITLPTAYIPLKDIASAAAMQKKKSKDECSPTLTPANTQEHDANNIINVTRESEENSGLKVTVNGKKIPPLKLKLRKSSQSTSGNNQKSPVKKTVSPKANKVSKKGYVTPQKPVSINPGVELDEMQPRIFLRISKANIPSMSRSLSTNDTVDGKQESEQHESSQARSAETSHANTGLPFSQAQPITCVTTSSIDMKEKIFMQENINTSGSPSVSITSCHSNTANNSPDKDIKESSKVECIQPAKIRSKIQRSLSLPTAIKAKEASIISTVTTNNNDVQIQSHSTAVSQLPQTKSMNSEHQANRNTTSLAVTSNTFRNADGNTSMKGTRVLKSSVTVVSTYNNPTSNPNTVSPTQMIARHEANVMGSESATNFQKAKQGTPSTCARALKSTNTKHSNIKNSQQTGAITQVFSVSPSSVFINANSTVPTVLSLSQIEALNQYLSSTNTAIAVSTGQIVTSKVQPSANVLPTQLVTSPIATELASTTQIVQMLLSTPPIATSVIPTQTCVAQQSDTGSKCSINYATMGNIPRFGNTPHLISIQGGRHISPITVNHQQPSANRFSIPTASLRLPIPVKRKIPTLNTVGPTKIIRLPVQTRLSVPEFQKSGVSASAGFTTLASQSQNVSLLTSSFASPELKKSANHLIPVSTVKESTNVSGGKMSSKVAAKDKQVSNGSTMVTVSPSDVTILGKVEQLVNASPTCTSLPVITSSIPTKTTTTTAAVQSQYITLLPKCSSQIPSSCPGHQPSLKVLNAMLTTTASTTKTGVTSSPLKNISTKCDTSESGIQLAISKNFSLNQTKNTQYPQAMVSQKDNANHIGQYTNYKLSTATSGTAIPSVLEIQPVYQKSSAQAIPSTSATCSIRLISLLSGDDAKSNAQPVSSIHPIESQNSHKSQIISTGHPNTFMSSSASHYTDAPGHINHKPITNLLNTSTVKLHPTATNMSQSGTFTNISHNTTAFGLNKQSSTFGVINPPTFHNSVTATNVTTPTDSVSLSQANNLTVSHGSSVTAPVVSPMLPQVYLGARHFLPPHISYHGIVYPGNGIVMVNGQPRLMTSQQSVSSCSGQPIQSKLPVKRSHIGEIKPTSEHLPANGYDAPLELTTKKYNSVEAAVLEK